MNELTTHGMWMDEEKALHINALELKAALLAIQSFCKDLACCHVRIEVDNTTAVSYQQYGWYPFSNLQ